jgi:Transcriptional regulators
MEKTCEEVTCEKLRELILNNRLPQGEFLSQRKLAEAVGATIVTLRSSLRLLENDGLIENVPKWGVRIPVETEAEIRDRYYFRELIEVGAVSKMLEVNPPRAREILMEKARFCDSLKPDGEAAVRDFANAHMELHLAITRLSGNRYLENELARINFRSMMLSNAKRGWEMYRGLEEPDYHQNFVRKLFDSSCEEALDVVREHIRRGCSYELKVLEPEK